MVWTVVNILVLYAVLKKFLLGPVMNIIHEREAMINGQFEAAKQEQETAEQMKLEYSEKLESAHAKAQEIIVGAKQRAEDEYAQTLKRTREESKKMLEKAQTEIESDREIAQRQAQAEIAKLAMLTARKIMKTGDFHDASSNQ